MLIAIGIIIAVLVVVYLYFLLNKAIEEPNSNISRRDPKKSKKNKEEGELSD